MGTVNQTPIELLIQERKDKVDKLQAQIDIFEDECGTLERAQKLLNGKGTTSPQIEGVWGTGLVEMERRYNLKSKDTAKKKGKPWGGYRGGRKGAVSYPEACKEILKEYKVPMTLAAVHGAVADKYHYLNHKPSTNNGLSWLVRKGEAVRVKRGVYKDKISKDNNTEWI